MNIYFFAPELRSYFEPSPTMSPRDDISYIVALASELAKIDDVAASIIFWEGSVSNLHHKNLHFCLVPQMIDRGVPIVSRFINQHRLNSVQKTKGSSFVFWMDINEAYRARSIANLLKASSVYIPPAHSPFNSASPESADGKIFCDKLKLADLIIVSSPCQLDLLPSVPSMGSLIIPLGVSAAQCTNKPSATSHILWTGVIEESAQPWHIFDLSHQNPEERFVMFGYPRESNLRNSQFYQYVLRRSSEIPNLTFIDTKVSEDRIREIFSNTKLLVDTSDCETFSFNQLVAMAHGAPVISHLRNFAKDDPMSKFVQTANGNTLDLNSIFESLIKDGARRLALRHQAKSWTEEHASISDSACRLVELLSRRQGEDR